MKHQALYPYKDKSKKIKCRLLHFLFGALMEKVKETIFRGSNSCHFPLFLLLYGDNF